VGPRFVSDAETDDASYLVALGCNVAFAGFTYPATDPPLRLTCGNGRVAGSRSTADTARSVLDLAGVDPVTILP